MHSPKIHSINPVHGPVWHGNWPTGRIEPNRRLYDFEIVYFSAGNGRVVTECGTYCCSAGSAIIIPPRLTHCTIADSPVERWCIHFDWYGDCRAHTEVERMWVYANSTVPFREELSAKIPELPDMIFPCFRRQMPDHFYRLIRRHFKLYPACAGDHLERKGILLEILGEFLRPESRKSISPLANKTFFEAKNRIDAEYSSPDLRIEKIAQQVCVTKNHLTKLFRHELGMSMLDYIHMRRLEHASLLLAESGLTVREAAFASGFNDSNYFIRLFRKKMGRTPGKSRFSV